MSFEIDCSPSRATQYALPKGVTMIGGRLLHFEPFVPQARLRITMRIPGEPCSEALGSVIHLNSDKPALRVCAPLEVEWATIHMAEIVDEAIRVWASSITVRHCDG